MSMLKQFIIGCLLLLAWPPLTAQQELSLHLMREVANASLSNPAFIADSSRIAIGLPSLYFSYHHTAGSIDQIIRRSDGTKVLDVDELIRTAKDENDLSVNLELQSLYFQYQLGSLAVSLHHAVKSNTFLRYPKTLPQLFWQGNSQFIDQTVEFAPEQQSFAYNELGLGLAFGQGGWRIGGRAKLLLGIGDVSTSRHSASLFTSNDVYQLRLDTDYKINTSLFDASFLFDSLSNVGIEYGWEDMINFRDFAGQNTGVAFDLGLQYQWNDRLELAVSVIDIGEINWKKNVTNYHSQGTFNYDGLDFSNILRDKNISFEGVSDTIEKIFNFKESQGEYSTRLPSKIFLSALYQLNDRWQLGGMYYQENFRGYSFPAFGLSARTRLANRINLGVIYALRNERFDNLGINASARFGPAQIFMHTDNVLAAFRAYDSDNVNFRAGLNLYLF